MSHIPSIQELERRHSVTFWRLVELEPRLELLMLQARQAGRACRSQADVDREFSPLRNRLGTLVGFSSQHNHPGILGRGGAYEVAYGNLYGVLMNSLPQEGDQEAPPAGKDKTMPEAGREGGPELAKVEVAPDAQPSRPAPTPG